MPTLVQDLRYLPEIDGLRAVAVLAVVLFHSGLGLPGGFVGVDVFFVISGYLITSLITKDLGQGSFSLSAFWERRARRIIPALVVVTLATLMAGYGLLLPADYAALGSAVAVQAAFAANIYYWRDTGYFSGGAEQKVLLHTWSLAVEEQFYLVLPLLIMALFRGTTERRRRRLRFLFSAGIVGSLALSTYAVSKHPAAAFYLLPTRAWELLLGATLVAVPSGWITDRPRVRDVATAVGLAAILIPSLCYTNETPFPGWAAVPPCLGAALVLWGTLLKTEKSPRPFLGKLLAAPALVSVGLLSYSLYLWHWPLFAFATYWALGPLPFGVRLFLVGVSFVLAFLSWKFVETPFRTRRLSATSSGIRAFTGASLAVVLVCGGIVRIMDGFPGRLSPQILAYANGKDDEGFIYEGSVQDIQQKALIPIGSRRSDAPVRVIVWGDSYAMAVMPAFDALLRERGLAGRAATHSSTAPVLGYYRRLRFGLGEDSLAFNDALFSYIETQHPTDVVLVAQWGSYSGKSDAENSASLESALLGTVRRLVSLGVRPWIFLQVPTHSFDVPKALVRAALLGEDISVRCSKPEGWNGLSGEGSHFLTSIESSGARLLDPRPFFLDPTGKYYMVARDGVPLYRDSGHLTTRGARLVILPFLRTSFVQPGN
jgi:peptidoglycan/LPS O-acetylase OafA/YrhL